MLELCYSATTNDHSLYIECVQLSFIHISVCLASVQKEMASVRIHNFATKHALKIPSKTTQNKKIFIDFI